ncbi:MAG: hypothetical protein AB8E15_10870 [Bdellovibrionales bacterium]
MINKALSHYLKALLITTFSACFCISLTAKTPPNLEWVEIETKYFRVIAPKEQRELAKLVLQYAHSSREVIKTYFPPSEELTNIVLNPTTDFANGSASEFPYPIIRLNTTMPSHGSSINGYSNWLYELILHEYVHSLHLRPSMGYIRYLKLVFGSIIKPNLLLPRFHTEGLATFFESKFSNGGRYQSTYYDGLVRAIELDQRWQDFPLQQIADAGEPIYPGGKAYFFGSLFVSEYVHQNGLESVLKFVSETASSVPYFLNDPLIAATGKDHAQIYQDAIERQSQRAKTQLNRTSNFSQTKNIFSKKENQQFSPHFSSDGTMVYISRNQNEKRQLRLSNKEDPIQSLRFIELPRLNNQGSKILFTKEAIGPENNYTYTDIFEHDLKTKKTKTVTKFMRASQASYSKEGKQITFIKMNEDGRFSLFELNRETNDFIELKKFPHNHRPSYPKYLNSNEIVFLWVDPRGRRGIHIFNKSKATITKVLPHLKKVRFVETFDESIFFISDHTGFSKIYSSQKPYKSSNQLVSSKTHLQDFSIDPVSKDIYFSELDSYGYHLKKIPFVKGDVFEKSYINSELKRNLSGLNSKEGFESKEKPYSPYKFLLPTYWLPFISPYGDGAFLSALTGQSDPLAKHNYSLQFTYDTLIKKTSHVFAYTNQSFDLNIDIISAGTYLQSSGGTENKISSNLVGLSDNYYGSTTWSWQSTAGSTNSSLSDEGARNVLTFSSRYSDYHFKPDYHLFPYKGKYFRSQLEYYMKNENTDGFGLLELEWKQTLSDFLPELQSFTYKIRGDFVSSKNHNIYTASVDSGGIFAIDSLNQEHNSRGYPIGNFVAYSMLGAELSYDFPLLKLYKGFFPAPVYLQQVHASLVFDSIIMDGFFVNESLSFEEDNWESVFASIGFELNLNSNLGFFIPFQSRIGAYYGLNKKALGDFQINLLFGLEL